MSAQGGTLWWLDRLLADETLDATEALLMIALAEHLGPDSDECWPSISRLAQRARCSYATARRRLAALEERGRIVRSHRYRVDGGKTTDLYSLCRGPLLNLTGGTLHLGAQGPLLNLTGGTLHLGAQRGTAHLGERAELPMSEPLSEEVSSTSTASLQLVVDEHLDRDFDQLWSSYPKRNGKRVGRKLAEQQWRKLTAAKRRAAWIAVVHYADACARELTIAKDPHRWLRDHDFDDWQSAAVDDRRRGSGPTPGRRASNDQWRAGGGFE